jgi:hypothetical protein
MAPNKAMRKHYVAECSNLKTALANWKTINTADLAALNAILARTNGKPIATSTPALASACS